jgi:hypothetical protein
MKWTLSLIAAGMMSASLASAQQVRTVEVPRPAARADVAADAGVQAGGSQVAMVSGGIGVDQREAMAGAVKNANLKLMFALNTGEYVSDVRVDVSDASGRKVVEHAAQGPWAYANLPAGTYTVTASFDGSSQSRKVTVGKGTKVVDFRWPARVDNIARQQTGSPGFAGETAAEAAATRDQRPQIK